MSAYCCIRLDLFINNDFEHLQNCVSPIQIIVGFCGPQSIQRYLLGVCTADALRSLRIMN